MQEIKLQIDKILVYLKEYYPLISCHMVNYFNKNLYENCTPNELKLEFNQNEFDFYDAITNHDLAPNLFKFTQNCKQFLLYNGNICININDFHNKFDKTPQNDLKLDVFMKNKKSHEVTILSSVAFKLKLIGNTSHIIDLGDGKGYLSSLLAFHYKTPILGIDSSETNTNGAKKRAEKLSKNWDGIVKNQKRTVLTPRERKTNENSDLYKQITQFVDENTNLNELIETVFDAKPEGISLIGLHTCGHLAVSSLNIFVKNLNVKTICNVSCCYHFLEEQFESDSKLIGFPMSDYLKSVDFKLGRPARMLSAQSIDRILSKKLPPSNTIFYRAILEVIFDRFFPDLTDRNVGRSKRDFNSFGDYVKESFKRLELDHSFLNDADIEEVFNLFVNREKELYFFTLLRAFMAPAIESLILLDRLLYLKENGVENSFLTHLFDPVVSPRCYGIIAFK
ncbi:probable methyltransferase-like protein 25 [Onthophagus taurus]|uniref:probable methyltransferase-like protein 25 n=1 Tax=Onthophagus taurus TaxID=166361 RepID=UPI000C209C36|nr:methyltransferase-like protein 25 [Onthophagus taurus]